ncbi:hemerythrin domain-containing protein [Candidatus Kuenenia stuttgartiensis]|nr:hemerythrin domain-containing protein [Candidatus Kuenenia stuttgartiensis]
MKKYCLLCIIILCLPVFSCANKERITSDSFKNYEGSHAFTTELLRTDFALQKRVLITLEKAIMLMEDNVDSVSKETFEKSIEVISYFFDICHIEKENEILFPFVKNIQGGMEKKDFLGRLLMEHISARDRKRALSDAVKGISLGKKARKTIKKAGYRYIKYVKKHLQTEEKALFPWIDTLLSHDDQFALIERLNAVEEKYISNGLHEKYFIMVETLEKQLGILP